jgi:SAM-dependent methyltransferase
VAPERRLIFGRIAELYDRHRPAYPVRLVEDLIELAALGGQRAALEVGAGTGKATVLFASRGVSVLGVEPSSEMAAVARRNCREYPGVQIEQSDFERWEPAGREFALVFSAQAWHWVDPEIGLERARAATSPGGLLAAFWNRPVWEELGLREALLAAYRRAGPNVPARDPMHPANVRPDGEEDWEGEIAASGGWGRAEIRYYGWRHEYSAAEYAGLLSTTSEIQLLPGAEREALLAAVRAVIEEAGGTLTLPLATRVCLAWAE